jgi:hypothetical protein
MSIKTLLLIVLAFALLGVIRTWSSSRNWGYWPSIIGGVVVIILILLVIDYM